MPATLPLISLCVKIAWKTFRNKAIQFLWIRKGYFSLHYKASVEPWGNPKETEAKSTWKPQQGGSSLT